MTDRRERMVMVRLSETERKRLARVAGELVPLATYVRKIVMEHVERAEARAKEGR